MKNASDILFCWFSRNQMKTNLVYHLITSCNIEMTICGNNYKIRNSKYEKVEGIIIDHKLNFKKAGQKIEWLIKGIIVKTTNVTKCVPPASI